MSPRGHTVFMLAALLLLAGCGPRHSVRVDPVPSRPAASPVAPAQQAVGGAEYRVVRGDTLYGIAFRHGLDYRQLAEHNRIGAPYTIYPGQRLRLPARLPPVTARVVDDRGPAGSPGEGVVAPIVRPAPVGGRPPDAPPNATAAVDPQPTPAVSPAPGTAAAAAAAAAAPSSTAAAATPLPSGPIRWAWPADGAVVASFAPNDPTRQGLNIAGSAGQPVRAAAAGIVVYSGSGLIGYGELVIVKHSDEWLSAYGHNRKRLVAEGEAVSAGQQIAEMGRSGASRDMLHFEIRRNGRPVDPAGLLPRR
jgi:lipoprotein NlpD